MNTRDDDKLAMILGRRSVRVYSPGDISDETVTRLLEAAMAAPSAMGKDPWRFVVVRDRATLQSMSGLLPGGKMLPSATLSIVVCGDLDAAFERSMDYMLQDCSAAVENLLLAAHALGLGACWVGIYPGQHSVAGIQQLFSLPVSFVPIAAITLGLPGEQLPPRTRYNAQSVRQEKWH